MQINDPAVIAELTSCHERYEKPGAGNPDREIRRLDILTFGDSAGIVHLEFTQQDRETQFWFRFADGWEIVSAHGSLLPGPAPIPDDALYLKAASAKIGLNIDALYQDAVKGDFSRLAAVAEFLMQFPLPQDVEPAPVFQP